MDKVQNKLSRRDVEVAYELLLGRRAKSGAAVAKQLKANKTLSDLRRRFMGSEEYRIQMRRKGLMSRPLDWPKMDIEVDVPAETLAAMLRHIEGNWAQLGEQDPHWSVLTRDRFRATEIGSNIKAFYRSGKRVISYFTHTCDRAGVNYKELRRCFELGCGVGRVSIWLAQLFPELIAADISAPHLRLAAEACAREGLKNVELRLLNEVEKIRALPDIDCFLSVIVLQHNPPPVIAFLLRTILGKLTPGGVGYFQVPTYRKNAKFSAREYLTGASIEGRLEMHVLPQNVLWEIAEEADCRILDVREDTWTGKGLGISNSILLRKTGER